MGKLGEDIIYFKNNEWNLNMGKNKFLKKKENLGINALLNSIKSGMAVIFPLVSYPYVLRILGKESIGRISYANSIIGYLSMLAMLGVVTYGVREGAQKRDNYGKFEKFVSEIFTINVISTCFAYALLLILIICLEKIRPYSILLGIQSISIIFTTIGMEWINTVYEDYFLPTIRSIIIHIISLVILFLFVKIPDDYYKYTLLTVFSNGLICVLNWFYIRRYVRPTLTLKPNIMFHIKPLMAIFLNSIAVSIYVNFDITMLGWIKGDIEVGLYTVSVRIYTIIKSLLTAIYVVVIPRLSNYIGEHDYEAYKRLYSNLWGWLTLVLIPVGVGLICISDEIMLFIGGTEYISASLSLKILSISLIFAVYGGMVTAVLNITIGKEKINLISTLTSAVINCGTNFLIIPRFGQYGAAITTLISEAFVLIFCLHYIENSRKYIDYSVFRTNLSDSIIGGVAIFGVTIFVKCLINSWVWRLMLILIGSCIVYVEILILRKNKLIMYSCRNLRHYRGKK